MAAFVDRRIRHRDRHFWPRPFWSTTFRAACGSLRPRSRTRLIGLRCFAHVWVNWTRCVRSISTR
jgi:hypothetical protein